MSVSRFFPISKSLFNNIINPLIIGSFSRAGRPPSIDNQHVFSAILYLLRTGVSWRDLPRDFGNWHSIYLRFQKWSERHVVWKILLELQKYQLIKLDVVMIDSTTFKVHRHGGGLKGGSKQKVKVEQA